MDSKNTKTTKIQPRQGDIWLFDPDPTIGSEIGKKIRPCLVISNNTWNKIRTGLVIVLPLSSVKKGISTHVKISPPEGDVTVESFALCEQIRSISIERLVKKKGMVSKKIFEEVCTWISDLISPEY